MIEIFGFPLWGLVVAILIFIVWAEIMYFLASQNQRCLFGAVFALGLLLPIAVEIIRAYYSVVFIELLWGIIVVLYMVFLGYTLYEQAGNEQRRWYYLTLIFPFLALVYQFVEKR